MTRKLALIITLMLTQLFIYLFGSDELMRCVGIIIPSTLGLIAIISLNHKATDILEKRINILL